MTELVLTVAVILVAIFAAYVASRSDATFKDEATLLREAKTLVEEENVKFKQGVEVLDKAAELLKQSTTQSAQQVVVLNMAAEMFKQSEMLRAREDFTRALDEAETFCSTCVGGCSPSYPIEIPLDRAVQAEITAGKILDSAEYNRLSTLGSSVWEVWKTRAIARFWVMWHN